MKCLLLLVTFCQIQDLRARLAVLLPLEWSPGVNFTNILWAAFAPKSFRQKIRNPNCKHIKAAQRTLVWLSNSLIFYEQFFHTKVLYAAYMCLQFGFLIFWRKDFGAKAAHKMLVKLTPVGDYNRKFWTRTYCTIIRVKVNKLLKYEWKVLHHFIMPRAMNSFNSTQALMSLAFLITFVTVCVYFHNFDACK